MRKIPIIVGITGHRDIREEDKEQLKEAVSKQLSDIKKLCPHSDIVVLTSLAKGSDLLCAEVAKTKYHLYIVLPMERTIYKEAQQFNQSDGDLFDKFYDEAKQEQKFVTTNIETPDKDIEKLVEDLTKLTKTQFPEPENKEILKKAQKFLYRQAGIYIVSHCHILLALWDGEVAKKEEELNKEMKIECGTAEVVRIATEGSYKPLSGISFCSSSNEAVLQLYTPKSIEDAKEPVGTKHELKKWETVQRIIITTDIFNEFAEAEEIKKEAEKLTKDDRLVDDFKKVKEKEDIVLDHIYKVYYIANAIAKKSQTEYRNALKVLAMLPFLITLFFLFYDEREIHELIIACGLLLLIMGCCYFYYFKLPLFRGLIAFLHENPKIRTKLDYLCSMPFFYNLFNSFKRTVYRPSCHERYLEYRVLSEDLRVQFYLRYAETKKQVTDLLPWGQQEDTAWIKDALSSLMIGGKEPSKKDNCENGVEPNNSREEIIEVIRKSWIQGQKDYHQGKKTKPEKDIVIKKRITIGLLPVSIILYIITLFIEGEIGGFTVMGLTHSPTMSYEMFLEKITTCPLIGYFKEQIGTLDDCRSWLKILLGAASAATLFAADYLGKLSPERVHDDHEKMVNFYRKMEKLLDNNKDMPEELLTVMAREMLIENGNWYSYQKDNKPDLTL